MLQERALPGSANAGGTPRRGGHREEIRHELWPNDTAVEFDQAINTAIRKLREALGENSLGSVGP